MALNPDDENYCFYSDLNPENAVNAAQDNIVPELEDDHNQDDENDSVGDADEDEEDEDEDVEATEDQSLALHMMDLAADYHQQLTEAQFRASELTKRVNEKGQQFAALKKEYNRSEKDNATLFELLEKSENRLREALDKLQNKKPDLKWVPAAPFTPLTEDDFDKLKDQICSITIHYRDSPYFPQFIENLNRELLLQSKFLPYRWC